MPINYNEMFKKELEAIGNRIPKLLLHVCCAPCLLAAVPKILGRFEITLYYYNPNITPVSEYDLRLAEVEKVAGIYGFGLVAEPYGFDVYKEIVGTFFGTEEHGKKCDLCCDARIKRTAEKARELGFEYFSTTLSSGPMKDANMLNSLMQAAARNGLKYLPSDFKKENGTEESRNLCKKYGIYRQGYCGCTPAAGTAVALTGGIGSGKSETLKLFGDLGFETVSADREVREIEKPGTETTLKIISAFPEASSGNAIDRKKLAATVFASPMAREKLEGIVYPELKRVLLRKIAENRGNLIIEVPLLFEKGFDKYFDYTVCVTAPEDIRTARVGLRDGRSLEEISAIISAQDGGDAAMKADFTIDNSSGRAELEEKVRIVAEKIRR